MENHPIPQDIAGFQFKLIGDMTIKQFAYLAAGCIVGWIFFTLPTPFLVKLPFISASVATGFSLAFIPVMGRPMDIIVFNFVKSLMRPTQYVYQKTGGDITPHFPQKQKKGQKEEKPRGNIQMPTAGVHPSANTHIITSSLKNKPEEREMTFFENLSSLFSKTPHAPPKVAPHVITADALPPKTDIPPDSKQDESREKKTEDANLGSYLEKEAQYIKEKLEEAKKAEKEEGEASPGAHEKVIELEKLLNDTLSEKMSLEQKIWELQRNLDAQKKAIFTPGIATAGPQAPKPQSQSIRQIPKGMGKSIGLPITPEDPNLVTGIVKDSRDNPLPNILVELKDREGNPVRAFKTNGLGQFAAATPLLNGVYTMEFEDPKGEHKFDSIEIKAMGEVILPIEAVSTDAREELRRSLFQQA